jgi:hypothetical protein
MSLAFAAALALAGAFLTPAPSWRSDSIGATSVEHPATVSRASRPEGRVLGPLLAAPPAPLELAPPSVRPVRWAGRHRPHAVPLVTSPCSPRGPPVAVA